MITSFVLRLVSDGQL